MSSVSWAVAELFLRREKYARLYLSPFYQSFRIIVLSHVIVLHRSCFLCTYFLKIHVLWGCTSGGVDVPCIYMHARWELPYAARVFVVLLVWRLSSAYELPCVLIIQTNKAKQSKKQANKTKRTKATGALCVRHGQDRTLNLERENKIIGKPSENLERENKIQTHKKFKRTLVYYDTTQNWGFCGR